MKSKENDRQTTVPKTSAHSEHIHITVDGCTVKLNFPSEPDNTAISDIKRMMLNGAVKI